VDEVLYFGDSKKVLYAVDIMGKEVWRVNVDGPIATNPLVKNGNIYFTAGTDTVYAYNLEGDSVWKQQMEGLFQGRVISYGDRLLVSPMNDQTVLYVLNENGTQQWAFVPEQK
jgi:outer membrane protein assembly factor BamB